MTSRAPLSSVKECPTKIKSFIKECNPDNNLKASDGNEIQQKKSGPSANKPHKKYPQYLSENKILHYDLDMFLCRLSLWQPIA